MKSKISAEISMEISENSAENSAENVNCLLDLYNARANLEFLHMFFAANFNPVKISKKCKLANLKCYHPRQNLPQFGEKIYRSVPPRAKLTSQNKAT